MAKLIRFDLPMNGKKVKDLDELRDNMTVEILDHYKTGLLAKWLRVRDYNEALTILEQITVDDDVVLLKTICGVFDIEVDDLIIASILKPEKPFTGSAIGSLKTINYHNYEEIIRNLLDDIEKIHTKISLISLDSSTMLASTLCSISINMIDNFKNSKDRSSEIISEVSELHDSHDKKILELENMIELIKEKLTSLVNGKTEK
jgi:hypothetical protein